MNLRMNRSMKQVLVTSFFIFAISSFANAKVVPTSTLQFDEARVFLPMAGSTMTAGYATVKNLSDKDVILTISEAAPFKAVETHESVEKDGRMSMNKIENFLVKSKGTLELKPGGNHIMLFEPTRILKDGETLKFKVKVDGKTSEVAFKVVPRADGDGGHHHHH